MAKPRAFKKIALPISCQYTQLAPNRKSPVLSESRGGSYHSDVTVVAPSQREEELGK